MSNPTPLSTNQSSSTSSSSLNPDELKRQLLRAQAKQLLFQISKVPIPADPAASQRGLTSSPPPPSLPVVAPSPTPVLESGDSLSAAPLLASSTHSTLLQKRSVSPQPSNLISVVHSSTPSSSASCAAAVVKHEPTDDDVEAIPPVKRIRLSVSHSAPAPFATPQPSPAQPSPSLPISTPPQPPAQVIPTCVTLKPIIRVKQETAPGCPALALPSGVTLSPELCECRNIVHDLRRQPGADPFQAPVNVTHYPTYKTVVRKPMDLGTIYHKLCSGEYVNADDVDQDVKLIWYNCRKFNPAGHPLLATVDALEAFWNDRFAKLVRQFHTKKELHFENSEIEKNRRRLAELEKQIQETKNNPQQLLQQQQTPAKIEVLKSDEPLSYSDIRRVRTKINDVYTNGDIEATTKICLLARSKCPKSVSVDADAFEFDLTTLDPRTVREIDEICSRALLRHKRKKSGGGGSGGRSVHSYTDSHKAGSLIAASEKSRKSQKSQKSQKSSNSSFGRENLASPPPSATIAGPAAVGGTDLQSIATSSSTALGASGNSGGGGGGGGGGKNVPLTPAIAASPSLSSPKLPTPAGFASSNAPPSRVSPAITPSKSPLSGPTSAQGTFGAASSPSIPIVPRGTNRSQNLRHLPSAATLLGGFYHGGLGSSYLPPPPDPTTTMLGAMNPSMMMGSYDWNAMMGASPMGYPFGYGSDMAWMAASGGYGAGAGGANPFQPTSMPSASSMMLGMGSGPLPTAQSPSPNTKMIGGNAPGPHPSSVSPPPQQHQQPIPQALPIPMVATGPAPAASGGKGGLEEDIELEEMKLPAMLS